MVFYISLIVISFSIFCTLKILKKIKEKFNFFSFSYIGLIVFCVFSLTVSSAYFFISTCISTYDGIINSKKYTTNVVDYTSHISYDEDNRPYTMYTPIVEFRDQEQETIKVTLDFSTNSIKIGDKYTILYNSENGNILTLGYSLVLKYVGSIIFLSIFITLSIGIFLFTFNFPMQTYKKRVSFFAFNYFIPFLMIGFELLLIYGLITGNNSILINFILIIFIVVLGLGILGYLKSFSENKSYKK